jgi:hypothetical protein
MLPQKRKKNSKSYQKNKKNIFITRGENPLHEYVIFFQEGIDLIGKF